jgi:hypothetical protein
MSVTSRRKRIQMSGEEFISAGERTRASIWAEMYSRTRW